MLMLGERANNRVPGCGSEIVIIARSRARFAQLFLLLAVPRLRADPTRIRGARRLYAFGPLGVENVDADSDPL
jgi:hypothetical protein